MRRYTLVNVILIVVLFFSYSCKSILVNKVLKTYDESFGEMVPNMLLLDSSGTQHQYASLHGKVVYLNLWGTWCKPCLEEVPFLNNLDRKLSGDSNIVLVNVCVESEFNAWRQLIRDKKFQGMHLYLPNDSLYPGLSSQLKIDEGLPHWRIVDKNGKTLGLNLGPDEGVLTIFALLEARKGTSTRTAIANFLRLAKSSRKNRSPSGDSFKEFIAKYN